MLYLGSLKLHFIGMRDNVISEASRITNDNWRRLTEHFFAFNEVTFRFLKRRVTWTIAGAHAQVSQPF